MVPLSRKYLLIYRAIEQCPFFAMADAPLTCVADGFAPTAKTKKKPAAAVRLIMPRLP
jgi:hypothetical protein